VPDGDRRTPASSSRSRTPGQSVRAPASRCPRAPASGANDAAAIPPSQGRKRTPDLVLRQSADATALGERQ
jgi:hypothetical protein